MALVTACSSPGTVEEVVETFERGDLVDLILLLQRTEASELDSEGERRFHERKEG